MMLRSIVAAGMLALVPALATAGSAGTDPAHGYWLTENGKAIVHVVPCGAQTCGRMVWVENARDASGALKLDARDQPICGADLVGGLSRAAPGAWQDGWIYNPRDGERYSAVIEAVSTDTLEVRGYLGVQALGKSQTWTRVGGDRGGCQ